jgi:hypothetical protein
MTTLPQHACRPGWEQHPQTDDGHAHHWHLVITQPWGPHHPEHREAMTVCRICTAPRCGHTFADDPCTERRHHRGLHITESGRWYPQSGMTLPPEDADA